MLMTFLKTLVLHFYHIKKIGFRQDLIAADLIMTILLNLDL